MNIFIKSLFVIILFAILIKSLPSPVYAGLCTGNEPPGVPCERGPIQPPKVDTNQGCNGTLNIGPAKLCNPASKFPIDLANPTANTNLAGLISSYLSVTLMIVAVLLFIWLAWGVFQYIFASGNKEALKKAQGRITWAIVGFVITILAYAISGFVQDVAKQNGANGKTFIDSPSTIEEQK